MYFARPDSPAPVSLLLTSPPPGVARVGRHDRSGLGIHFLFCFPRPTLPLGSPFGGRASGYALIVARPPFFFGGYFVLWGAWGPAPFLAGLLLPLVSGGAPYTWNSPFLLSLSFRSRGGCRRRL